MAALSEVNLAPGLLLAMPQLDDPNFSRSVVLMVEHNAEGSFGLVLNSPVNVTVPRLLDHLELSWTGDPEATVYSGGPVMPTSGWVVHAPVTGMTLSSEGLADGMADGESVPITDDIVLTASPENMAVLAAAPPKRYRFLLGYSGWGAGQLAHEMARGSWLHADATPELVFDTPHDDMWKAALRSIGVDPESLVQTRGIH